MKKLFVLFLLFFTTDSFATGIGAGTSTAPCDNATLSKYTGTVNAEINWEPNTINLKWYDGETELNVANASQSCTYDGMITVPPQPTKPGYTFNGWKIPKMDFGTIDTSERGLQRWAKGKYNNADYCWIAEGGHGSSLPGECSSDSTYNELQQGEWMVRFSHGTLYGISRCSVDAAGTRVQAGNPSLVLGIYCWCQARLYRATNTNVAMSSSFALPWVFLYTRTTVEFCEQACPTNCANYAQNDSSFRTVLFTPAN